jgi:hypothetical protein
MKKENLELFSSEWTILQVVGELEPCTAPTIQETLQNAYTFWTHSRLSRGAPYYAGVVVLCIQVNPDLRPDQIDKLLYDSGWDFQKGRLNNPVGFIEAAQKVE